MINPDNTLNYNRWIELRKELYSYYSKPNDVIRVDVEIIHPSLLLSETKIDFNPHRINFPHFTCFYCWDDWSVIFDPINDYTWKSPYYTTHTSFPGHGTFLNNKDYFNDSKACRLILESGHHNPKGERVVLFHISNYIWTEPWAVWKPKFYVFYKNRFWTTSFFEWDGEYSRESGLPFSTYYRYHVDLYNRNFKQSHLLEKEDKRYKYWFNSFIKDPKDISFWYGYSDWLYENGDDFGQYIQEVLKTNVDLIFNYRFENKYRAKIKLPNSDRKINSRSLKFFFLKYIQLADSDKCFV